MHVHGEVWEFQNCLLSHMIVKLNGLFCECESAKHSCV